MRFIKIVCIIVFMTQTAFSQRSQRALELFEQAKKDTAAKLDSIASLHFYNAAVEEKKEAAADANFVARMYLYAARQETDAGRYNKAHDLFIEALQAAHKAPNRKIVFAVLNEIGGLYDKAASTVFDFPKSNNLETIEAYFPLVLSPEKKTVSKYLVVIRAGSNDGMYNGAEGRVVARDRKPFKDRGSTDLGKLKVIRVEPNISVAEVDLFKTGDPYYDIYAEDLVVVPIRFPKKLQNNLLVQITLLDIYLLNNSKKWLAHPRTLLYYNSPELEQAVFESIKEQMKDIADRFRNDTILSKPMPSGRYKGRSLLEGIENTTPADIKAFLDFTRTFSASYMGLGATARFSEMFATWLLNGAPPGSTEAMDSLIYYKGNQPAFDLFVVNNKKDLFNTFFSQWQTDAQDFAYAKEFQKAYRWNEIMRKVGETLKNDSLLAWGWFNKGLIESEDDKDSASIESYKKARVLFNKSGDRKGESYSINNIATRLRDNYRYAEAQTYLDASLQIRLQMLARDTSADMKEEVGRAYSGSGYSLFKQGKYNESTESYLRAVEYYKQARTLKATKQLAALYNGIGKNFEKLGNYTKAIEYYDLEFNFQKALGDDESMADALDNRSHLISNLGRYREAYEGYETAYNLHKKAKNEDGSGFSMSNMGQCLWSLGKLDSAIIAHNSAIKIREAANNPKGVAYSWKKLGILYRDNGQPQKSIEAYGNALNIYKTIDDKESYASLQEDMAANYYNVKDYSRSMNYYRNALDIYRQIKDRSKSADVLYDIATVYYSDNNFEQAEKILDSAISIQSELKEQTGLLKSYIYKGLLYEWFHVDYKNALAYMKDALRLSVLTTSEYDIAYTQKMLGNLYQSMGRYDSAKVYMEKALALYNKLEDKRNVSRVYMEMGYLYTTLADYDESRNYFHKALNIAEKSNNMGTIADAIAGIGQIELYNGNFSKAFLLADSVHQMWIKENNPYGIASTFNLKGNIRNRQNSFNDAIKYYLQTDSVYARLGIDGRRATSKNNIGDIYLNQNDYDKALKYFTEALNILEKTNDDKSFISMVKSNIGELYIYQKKYKDAETWMSDAMEIAKSINNTRQILGCAITLGKLKTITGELQQAGKYFEQADQLIKKKGDMLVGINLEADWGRWFFFNNDQGNAEKHLNKCIEDSRNTGYNFYIWRAYSTLSELKQKQNKPSEAIIYLEKAISVIDVLKQNLAGGEEANKIFSSDESVVELYQRMAKYLKAAGRNDEALAYMEKANIENINLRLKNEDAIGSAEAKEKKSEIYQYEKQKAEELAKPLEQQNKEKIARLEKMSTIAEEDYQQFIANLAKKYPGRTDLQQIDAREFRKERKFIPQDVALLSYLLTDQELSVFIVTKDSLLIRDIPLDRKLLEKKIRQFYNASAHAPSKDGSRRGAGENEPVDETVSMEDLSAELYALLIGPAADAIADKKRIAIVPSGLLCFVPFQSLAVKDATGKANYFGDSKQVFYVNKITTVTNGRNQVLNDMKIVAVGNADNTLENAATEVKGLQQLYPSTKIYLGNEATKQKVLNTTGEYNVLHLATHGRLDYNNAENSYLVFAADKMTGDDGKLKINDIYHIKDIDRFRLVTLSACETAVVQSITEGWPISTASAFIEAGVPTVIATLWKVDDKATSILVEKFYANMKTMDKVAALQNAQQYLKQQKEYSDPNYWAPFQLVGLWQ